jgi:hypothetical protein
MALEGRALICENYTDVALLSETSLSLHGSFSFPNYHSLCDGFLDRKGAKSFAVTNKESHIPVWMYIRCFQNKPQGCIP